MPQCFGCCETIGIHIRAAQRWVKRYYEDPESIFEKKKKSDWRCILGEEHKQFILNYIDENPSAALTEVVEGLMQGFVNLNIMNHHELIWLVGMNYDDSDACAWVFWVRSFF